ncbi:hypothetical protein HPG69_007923 [Diceros bicornis minor]|uniref:Uncharacterized protein n=1 Tax=Diceros bicornis minor TaxID=77932 RepID=A0A7J7EAS2_DICBM|nr:hypothetical protein HPG69_007923 [Diceros bicornis minor]
MLAKISNTWKLLLKLLGPDILFSSLKSTHSFPHSPSHLGLMHRHEHLLRKTTKTSKQLQREKESIVPESAGH